MICFCVFARPVKLPSGRVAVFLRALNFALGNETVSIADGRAALAFSDYAAQVQGLAEGQPVLTGEARLKDRAPQDQDIDPGIAPSGDGVPGQAKPRFGPAPRLHPRHAALFKFGDYLVRDALISVRDCAPRSESPLLYPGLFQACHL